MRHAPRHPISINTLDQGNRDTRSLATAARDYVEIEAETALRNKLSYYAKPLHERLRSGETILMTVEEIEGSISTDPSESILISGKLKYDRLRFTDPDSVKSAIRKKQASGTSMGSFMHAIPFTPTGIDSRYTDPRDRVRSPTVTIHELDIATDTITVEYRPNPGSNKGDYLYSSHWFVGSPSAKDYEVDLHGTKALLLEPSADNYTASRIATALNTLGEQNGTIDLFDGIIAGGANDTHSNFDTTRANDFVNWLSNPQTTPLEPNDKQRKFIADIENELLPIQGPPGTGKTSGALAPAIVARVLSHKPANTGSMALVTGPSNKAIDEAFESIAELVDAYQSSSHSDDALDDITLIRVSDPPEKDSNTVSTAAAEYNPLYDDADVADLIRRYTNRRKTGKDTILFATPTRTLRLGEELATAGHSDSLEDLVEGADGDPRATAAIADATSIFDIIGADEASMLSTPRFLAAGTFYSRQGTVIVSGDHRQLPPVQEHDWTSEHRPSIRSIAPHLSALDFVRLLHTDTPTDIINPDIADLLDADIASSHNNITFHRLERSYRNHTDLADFLQRTIYSHDNITFHSNETATISRPSQRTAGINAVTNPDAPVTVVTYDSTDHQQSNPTEALLTAEVLDAVQEDNLGVVTPHNAQRGLLNRTLDTYPSVPDDTDIATVERFQGGERDVMVVNTTVSDPGYIDSESEFLLNLNRINVSLSRMRKKLIVFVAESIFSHIPSDTHEYEQARVWKALATDTGIATPNSSPEWTGTLDDFVTLSSNDLPTAVDSDTKLEVHYL